MSASLRVQRHDTGAWVSIPADSLRWGPNLGHSTCRAALLLESIDSVPYFLPFPGAKFAVRVTLPEKAGEQRADDELCCPACRRPFVLHGIACETLSAPVPPVLARNVAHAVLSEMAGTEYGDRRRLRQLLNAAADALRSGAAEDEPDALGQALELLAECLPALDVKARLGKYGLWVRVRDFLEEQISGEIRRAFPGLPVQEIETLRSAVAWLQDTRLHDDALPCAIRLKDVADRLEAQGPADV